MCQEIMEDNIGSQSRLDETGLALVLRNLKGNVRWEKHFPNPKIFVKYQYWL